MAEPVPVIVVCGFLGAGKTTLLRRILSDPQGVRYGVLVNDFGAIDIDGVLLAETGADQVVLNNGCICCSIQDDLGDALDGLLARSPAPERVIVETSGVSRPLPVADAIASSRFAGRAQLDGIYCLIDTAGFGDLDFASTEVAMDQAVGADLVVLNKTDLASADEIASVEASLRGAMPMIRTVTTRQADIPRELLFSLGARDRPAHQHEHEHEHHHDDEFEAWHWVSRLPLDAGRVRKAVRSLPVGILRAKGVVRVDEAGERLVFHVVGKRSAFTSERVAVAESVVVAIGRRGSFDPAALTALFDAC